MLRNTEELIPQAFSPSLLAEMLGISRSTAYRIAKEERLSITVGGRKVIFRREYEKWLQQKNLEKNEYANLKKANITHSHPMKQAGPIERHYA